MNHSPDRPARPAHFAMRSARRRVVGPAFALLFGLVALAAAQADEPTLLVSDFSLGAPAGSDAFANGIGYVTWQDGGGSLDLSTLEVAPGDPLALPDQTGPESLFRVEHAIASWGGFTHAFADEALTRWTPLDLSAYAGLRFWYAGDGRGGAVQVDLFDDRNPEVTGDSAERWFYRFTDDTTAWRRIEIPFSSFARRTDFQPGGAPDNGLGLQQVWGWALGFPPGQGTSHLARVEAYGAAGTVSAGAIAVAFDEPLVVVNEGDDTYLRVVLSRASEEAISVRVFVRADEAEAFRDVIPVNELVVFPAGVTAVEVRIRTLQDGRHEGDERALAVLDGPRGAELGFQRRAVVTIRDDDPFDADLLAEFGDGRDGFEGAEGTAVAVRELLADTPDARPGGDPFERTLALDWDDVGRVSVRFAEATDASGADGLGFWYHGDGLGRTVTVEVLDDGDPERPWELTWADAFDGPAGALPDPAIWTPELGDGTGHGNPGWGNAERQTYTADPANVALNGGGQLVIRALQAGDDAPPCYYAAPCEYTSARLVTAGDLEVTYGRIEARLQLPHGQGLWPAFWLLGNDVAEVSWPASGEIDIMEHIGREPNLVHGTIHGPGYAGAEGIGRSLSWPGDTPFAEAFHDFAVDWTPASITWSVDGTPFSTLTPDDLPAGTDWVFDHPFFLILNLAVGGTWPGYPDATTVFPQELVVDHVRVYQAPDTSERFATSFQDDVAGWRYVRLPFAAFERAEVQPDGAPDDGFGRSAVWGLTFTIDGGAGTALLDEVGLFGRE